MGMRSEDVKHEAVCLVKSLWVDRNSPSSVKILNLGGGIMESSFSRRLNTSRGFNVSRIWREGRPSESRLARLHDSLSRTKARPPYLMSLAMLHDAR
jgi:hypothetical protein